MLRSCCLRLNIFRVRGPGGPNTPGKDGSSCSVCHRICKVRAQGVRVELWALGSWFRV